MNLSDSVCLPVVGRQPALHCAQGLRELFRERFCMKGGFAQVRMPRSHARVDMRARARRSLTRRWRGASSWRRAPSPAPTRSPCSSIRPRSRGGRGCGASTCRRRGPALRHRLRCGQLACVARNVRCNVLARKAPVSMPVAPSLVAGTARRAAQGALGFDGKGPARTRAWPPRASACGGLTGAALTLPYVPPRRRSCQRVDGRCPLTLPCAIPRRRS